MDGPPLPAILVRGDDPAWDEWLGVVARDIYHGARYHHFSHGCGEGDPYLVVVGDNDRGLAWPYLLRPTSELKGLEGSSATDVGSVYGYPGPIAWGCAPGDEFVRRAWAALVGVWRDQGAVSAFTRFHPLLDNAALLAGVEGSWAGSRRASGSVVAVGPTVSVDCTLDDDAARGQYARALRQHIAAGRRAGLVTGADDDWSDLEAFCRLYHETMARNRASASYFFDLSYFRRLTIALSGHLHLLVTKLGDDIAAAGLFTEFDGIVQAHLVGTNGDLRSLSPFKVLLDDARAWARARGDVILHLGGGRGGRDDSLFRFKGEFSPRRHVFHVGRWVLDPASCHDLLEARMAALSLGATLDAAFFPAYRAPEIEAAELRTPLAEP
ncbi:MAG TPA: GNAT family N-acetyltransferase [Vicinamibacterales bacterium]|nr:GNAT family N-acetyltransferase [Vicinamibacterales bacterium]